MDQFGRIPLFGTWSGLPAARGDVDLELDAANVAQCLGAFACRTNGAESKPNGQETGTESRFMDDALQHLYISFSLFLPVRPTANAHVTHVGQMQNAKCKMVQTLANDHRELGCWRLGGWRQETRSNQVTSNWVASKVQSSIPHDLEKW